jgi:hypothetical protein
MGYLAGSGIGLIGPRYGPPKADLIEPNQTRWTVQSAPAVSDHSAL